MQEKSSFYACANWREERGKTDRISKSQRSYVMSKVRGRDTKLEVAVRKFLWSKGYRYRTHYGYGKADIAFPRLKVAIFLDSCFWHACPRHAEYPKSNAHFWRTKLRKNRQRDRDVTRALQGEGWRVVRVWEHNLEKNFHGALEEIEDAVRFEAYRTGIG